MAKSSPARVISLAMAWLTLRFLSSKLPAQPTQYRYSWSKASPGSTTGISASVPSSPLAQSDRSPWDMPHGFEEFSIDR